MGVASLAPAFPKIIEYYHISVQKVGLLIAAFTLPGIFLTPLLGILADRIGRKKVLVPSLILFAFAGTACAFIKNFEFLLVVRFFQGVGAASIGSLNITLIGDIFEGQQRGKAMGYNASILSIGTACYPAIGGLMASFSWNYPFLLSFLALPVGLLVVFSLKNVEPKKDNNFKKYLLDAFSNIAKWDVLVIYFITFLIFIVLYGSILTYIPILLKQKFDSPPHKIGILLSAMALSMGVAATFMGKISRKFSPPVPLIIAGCLYIIALTLVPVLPSFYLMLIPILIYGFGNGLILPILQTVLAGKASLEQRGIFMSFNGMVLRLGQTVGPIITGLAYTLGIEWAFWCSILAAILLIILSFKVK